jgi:hypothetical protein
MKKRYLLLLAAASLGLYSCDTTRTTETATSQTSTAETTRPAGVMEKDGLRMYSFDDSPKFPESALRLREPVMNAQVPSGEVQFVYDVTNFQLTKQTQHMHEGMANSHQGQHIHNIIDNEPYTAHYETSFKKPVKDGNHVVLSFLSRSFHESLKHRQAYDLRLITVGKTTEGHTFDPTGQHMFYSRPKGDYTGPNETKKIMLDFYLVNTDLAADGNKVRATVNGTGFMLDKWLPYIIEGLPMGESTIKLELLDNDGNVIEGPYNTVERKITLKEA